MPTAPDPSDRPSDAGDPAPAALGSESLDSPAEVDAVFRTQRRIGVGYAAVFALVLAGVSILTVTLGWWTSGRVVGGMSPGFLVAAVGLYLVFVAVATAAGSLANAVEDRMLGGADDLWRDERGAGGSEGAAGPEGVAPLDEP